MEFFFNSIEGLGTGFTSGKASFNVGGKPLFIEAFIATSFRIPSWVKCYFLSTILTMSLNKIKSISFLVINGNF